MELPEGWKLVKLGDIADILDKFRKPLNRYERETRKGNIPYCGANGIIDYINDYIFDGEYLLVAEDGGFFKKFERSSYLFKGKFWANNHVHVLQIKKEFSLNKYVYYVLYFENLEKYCSGATRLKLNQKKLKEILIPIPYKDGKPDLQKQKEIVNKIETLFNNIDKAIELRQKAINETKDLFNSVLNKIFKDEGFKLVRLGDIAEKIKAGGTPLRKNKEYWENGTINLVKISDITKSNKYLLDTEEKITENGLKNSSAWLVNEGSILLSMYGTVGEVVINKIPVAITQNIAGILLKKDNNIQ
ncbi:restriction endonuclease subunit S [Methanothermococcus okinawensis]|uniref:restriction endonuclease subunit S n=1 Tax=Methanothermococcus okinawensis TaxID=155863 RepID=UPI00064E2B2E|nr:restriction endonuclease subunit S [Methanothermococcus okinawensis]